MIQKVTVFIILFIFIMYLLIKDLYFGIFTSDPEVFYHLNKATLVVAFGFLPDYWSAMVNGCIRALGI
jgi:Na+-driven multidrug efflux pump